MTQGTQFPGRASTYPGSGPDLKDKATDTFEKTEKMADKATDQFGKVADQVEGYAKAVVDKGREVGHDVGEVTDRFRGAVDKSVREQPMTTLAIAAVVGFVLGALWKS